MNWAVIILGTLLVISAYLLFVLYPSKTTLVEKMDLKQSNPDITYSSLSNPNASRYSYSTWIFVNTWSNLEEKTIFSRPSAAAGANDIRLYLDKDSPILKCDIMTETKETIVLTDNFPIQKWVYVIVSVDNQIVDMYLDGKLVVSKKLAKMPVVPTGDIKFGGSGSPDIILSRFSRFTFPMDPQTAWSKYMDGNGITSNFPNYGMKLTVLKDGIDQKQIKFF